MGDGYWNRQPTLHSSAEMLKRPRSDYDLRPSRVPSVYEHNYLAQEDDRDGAPIVKDTRTIGSAYDRDGAPIVKDTRTIGSAYDRYLQNAQLTPFTAAEASTFSGVGLGMPGLPLKDMVPMGRSGTVDSRLPVDTPDGRGMGFDGRLPVDVPGGRGLGFDDRLPVDVMPRLARETLPLPPDASNTLYVEGLPRDCTRREVAHIFRPFVGYKEARLVSKDSRQRGGDPLILCFVDFVSPACAATALSALQGYKMDEHDPDSANLRLQFSKHPGPRSGSGYRGRR